MALVPLLGLRITRLRVNHKQRLKLGFIPLFLSSHLFLFSSVLLLLLALAGQGFGNPFPVFLVLLLIGFTVGQSFFGQSLGRASAPGVNPLIYMSTAHGENSPGVFQEGLQSSPSLNKVKDGVPPVQTSDHHVHTNRPAILQHACLPPGSGQPRGRCLPPRFEGALPLSKDMPGSKETFDEVCLDSQMTTLKFLLGSLLLKQHLLKFNLLYFSSCLHLIFY